MKRKALLMTLAVSISLASIPVCAATYNDPKMSPSYNNNYSNSSMQNSPVVLNYNGYNTSPQYFMPQNNSENYGPSNYQGSLPSTPQNIKNADVSPVTTNYGKSTGISYELNLGSIYGTAEQRGDLVSSIKNMPLTKIGIGRTVSELTSICTVNNDDSNYWSYDSNSNDNIIFRCGNYIITFKNYKTSYGIDVYAKINYAGQTTYYLTEAEISNFFADLSNKLYEKEMKEKEEKEAEEKAKNNNVTYNNSVVVNGNNYGDIVYNN